MISVDDVLMEHVFTNLLENSAKYSPAGSPVDIVARKQDASVMIEVMDRGPGFIPGDEKRVFGKFYRGSVEGIRGAGLGLAICQAIVTAHRGAIVAENRPGGGATIRIILPVGGTPPEVPADA